MKRPSNARHGRTRGQRQISAPRASRPAELPPARQDQAARQDRKPQRPPARRTNPPPPRTTRTPDLGFYQAVLDSLSAHIAILDAQGVIVSVNSRWQQFAREHGTLTDPSLAPGANYLAVCRRAIANGDGLAVAALKGIEGVLSRARPSFQLEYTCDGPGRSQWFLMEVEPIASAAGGAIVSHLDITARKQAEMALQASNARLVLAQQSAGSGVWDWDLTTNRLVWAPELFRLFGLDPLQAEASFDTWRAVMHPEDRLEAETRTQAAAGCIGRWQNEYRIFLPTGEIRWINSLGETVGDAQGRPVRMTGICLDITERKQAEAARASQREELQTILDATPAFIFYKNRDNRFLRVNWAFADIMQKPKDQLEGRSLFELYPREQAEAFWRDDQEVMASGQPKRNIIEPLQTPAGQRWVQTDKIPYQDDRGVIIGVIGFAVDITERKAAEEKLAWLASFPQLNPNPIAEIELAGGETKYANPACQRLFPDLPRVGVAHPWLAGVRELAAGLQAAGGFCVREVTVGGACYHQTVGRTPDGQHVRVYGTDITERKRVEDALRESQTRLELALEAAGQGTFEIELTTENVTVSPRAAEILGVDVAYELKTLDDWRVLVVAEDRPLIQKTITGARQGEGPNRMEFRIKHLANGTIRWVRTDGQVRRDQDGQPCRLVGVIRDITARKQAELALRASERRFRQVAESLPQLVWTCRPDGPCDYLGPQWVSYTGKAEAEQLGFGWLDQVHPDDRPRVASVWQVTAVRGTNFRIEFRIRRHDGAYRWFRTLAVPLRDENGDIVRWFGSNTDIQDIKEAEEALRRSREDLDRAQEVGQIGSWRLDVRRNVLAWSEENYRIFGVPKGTPLTYESFLEFVHPDDRHSVDAHWRAALQGEPYDLEHRLVVAGEVRWVREKAYLEFDESGGLRGGFGITQDITERRRVEEALRESESFYRQTLESIPGMVFTTRPDGYCDFQSQQWVEFTGIPMSEHVGDGWNKLLHPDDRPRAFAAWRDAVEGRAPYDIEYRVRRRDGYYEWFKVRGQPIRDAAGQIVRWFGTALNIDDLVNARTALERSERLYRAIGESIDYGIWICEPDGRNTYASESFLKLVGLTQEQCASFGWGDVLHPDDAAHTMAAWKECVRTGGLWDIEHRYRGVDGQWHPILARGVAVRDDDGRVLCWAGINLDISRLKRAEEHLKASLREKEVLLQEIHHRVKNNLQVISSLINLQGEALPQPALQMALADVRDRVRTMALVHEKLYQSGDLARLNFADYAASLLHYLWRAHGTAAATVRLQLAILPVTLPVAIAVPCGLILNELATNALKHAFPDRSTGEVTVGLARAAATGQVCLRVSDNGVGLPAGLDWRQSRSLGLRLVQMLAQQLHGMAEASTGPGTEFRVTFPLPEET